MAESQLCPSFVSSTHRTVARRFCAPPSVLRYSWATSRVRSVADLHSASEGCGHQGTRFRPRRALCSGTKPFEARPASTAYRIRRRCSSPPTKLEPGIGTMTRKSEFFRGSSYLLLHWMGRGSSLHCFLATSLCRTTAVSGSSQRRASTGGGCSERSCADSPSPSRSKSKACWLSRAVEKRMASTPMAATGREAPRSPATAGYRPRSSSRVMARPPWPERRRAFCWCDWSSRRRTYRSRRGRGRNPAAWPRTPG